MRSSIILTLVLTTFLSTCGRAQAWQSFRFDHDGRTVNMETLMRESHTPGVSIALDYGDGDTTWTHTVTGEDLFATTLFPMGAASSAPLCALVLQLVERGQIDLDTPVNEYLKQVKLPRNVTTRELLLFQVKFKVGYKPDGYAAGETLPTFVDLVRELRPQGKRKAGANSSYGQWLVLQLLVEDIYGEDLATVAARELFRPLGLTEMFYATELTPAQLARAARGHDEDGSDWPGTYQRYVATGSHGLWSTPLHYVRFVRAMLDIKDGLVGSVLKPETVEMALNTTYDYRSLLFHLNDNGLPYWGGNAKGYYFQMQAHPVENWISAAAVNRQLNWRLGGPLIWQAGKLAKQWRSEGRLGIILQPGQESDLVVAEMEHYAFINDLRTERLFTTDGLPAGITATPAYVFQSPAGRAVFSGKHASVEALERFVRASRVSPKKTAVDERTDILTLTRGRQQIVLPLKLTATLPGDLEAALGAATGFEKRATVHLTAQDRRIYLDVHPYRTTNDDYQVTYALFSQFNCHEPVVTTFGDPVSVDAMGNGMEQLAARIADDLSTMLDPTAGFVPVALPAATPIRSWAALGWNLDQAVLAAQETAAAPRPVALSGSYRVALTPQDAPGLFFSFPAPLDRYAGEINELTASFTFHDRGTRLSGQVNLPVSAISTGSGSLDTYVLGDILKSDKHPTASLTFSDARVPTEWQVGVTQQVTIPAKLTVRGKTYPVRINASFVPTPDGKLVAKADFGLDFKKVFNNDGPDGPEDIRRHLGFTASLLLAPAAAAR